MRLEQSGYRVAAKTFDISQSSASAAAPAEAEYTGVTDTIADDTSTTTTIKANGEHLFSSIDMIEDQDFVKVKLEAGQVYDIGMYASTEGTTHAPLADSFIELYDKNGKALGNADGGKPEDDNGLDALLTFEAEYTGTYYINARAFDQDGTNGANGDGIGDYDLFVRTSTVEAYKPFYDIDQPMHSIDWGTQVDGTSRNPDGDQGPRPNGVKPDRNADSVVDGKNVITYYIAKQGDFFMDEDPTTPGTTDTMIQARDWQDWELADLRTAMGEYSEVADIVYVEVDDRKAADFKFINYQGTPGLGASLLGRMSPPGTENEGQAEFNSGDERWTQEGLQQGGFFFTTLLHEMGHGHGMAHPHDNGGHSSIMPGADGGTGGLGGGYGDYELSQQVFTVMSYNDGYPLGPNGNPESGGDGNQAAPYGWMGTLGALDIAVIQDKYGVNEDYHAGNDTYVMDDENVAGETFYQCIWDAGGTDRIHYSGERDSYIDLRAATLKYEIGGAGWVSYADGVYSGYTIANGVTIENAMSGAGDDLLIGNKADNRLEGRDGRDELQGGNGDDQLFGGDGRDFLKGGGGNDRLVSGDGKDVLFGGGGADVFYFEDIQRDRIRDLDDNDTISLVRIDADTNTDGVQHFHLADHFTHTAGEALLVFNEERGITRLQLDVDGDARADMVLELKGDQTGFTGFEGLFI
ncbi:MAG TPA: M10 family metallopeptidase C-terminal domain-containing protein [Caulobacteraceae bacterium]|jgi:Ca2+-binding RTX toxin-like protein